MKDTNEIEKALMQKVNAEVKEIVDRFIADIRLLSNKYGGSMFYDFQKGDSSHEDYFHVQGTYGIANVLHRMLLNNHGEKMLKYKSQELIKKLDIKSALSPII